MVGSSLRSSAAFGRKQIDYLYAMWIPERRKEFEKVSKLRRYSSSYGYFRYGPGGGTVRSR